MKVRIKRKEVHWEDNKQDRVMNLTLVSYEAGLVMEAKVYLEDGTVYMNLSGNLTPSVVPFLQQAGSLIEEHLAFERKSQKR